MAVGNPCRVIRFLKPNYQIRILEDKDIFQMRDLFRDTVLNVNARDYTEEEVKDWTSCWKKTERWKELLLNNQYVGALILFQKVCLR